MSMWHTAGDIVFARYAHLCHDTRRMCLDRHICPPVAVAGVHHGVAEVRFGSKVRCYPPRVLDLVMQENGKSVPSHTRYQEPRAVPWGRSPAAPRRHRMQGFQARVCE